MFDRMKLLKDIPALSFVKLSLLLIAFGCSLFIQSSTSVLLAPVVVCCFLFFALSVRGFALDDLSLPKEAVPGLLICVSVWIGVTTFWSSISFLSTWYGYVFALGPLVFFSLYLSNVQEKTYKLYYAGLYCIAFCAALLAVFLYVFFFKEFGPRIEYPFANANNLAALINVGIILSLGGFFRSRTMIRKAAFVAVSIVFYAGLIVTQSRTGFVCMFAAVALLAYGGFQSKKNNKIILAVGFVVICCAVPFGAQKYYENVNQQVQTESLRVDRGIVNKEDLTKLSSLKVRVLLWNATFEMIDAHPWLGSGLATFAFHYPQFRKPGDNSLGFFAHNDFLQLWFETGIFTLCLLYLLGVIIFVRTVNALKRVWDDRDKRVSILTMFCAMFVIISHTHLSFHLYVPCFLILIGFLLYGWNKEVDEALKTKVPTVHIPKAARWAAVPLTVLLCGFLCAWPVRVSIGSYYLDEATQIVETHKSGTDAAGNIKSYLDKADFYMPEDEFRVRAFYTQYYLERIYRSFGKVAEEEIRDLYDKAMGSIDKAIELNSTYGLFHYLKARVYLTPYGVDSDEGLGKAIASLERAIQYAPLLTEARLQLSALHKSQEDFQKARDALEGGLNWPRSSFELDITFLMELAEVRYKTGDKLGAEASYLEAQKRATQAKRKGLLRQPKQGAQPPKAQSREGLELRQE
jgi:O-antigen ligase